jgi:hypothetical protein
MRAEKGKPETWARRHEPFKKGNALGLVHGAGADPRATNPSGASARVIAKRAARIQKKLLVFAPWLDSDEFIPAVKLYLNAAARESLLHDHIIKTTAEKGTAGVPQRLHEAATAATRLSAQLGDDLGLSPAGRARLQILTAAAAEAEAGLFDEVKYTEEETAKTIVRVLQGVLTDLGIDPKTPATRAIVTARLLEQDAIEGSAEEIP